MERSNRGVAHLAIARPWLGGLSSVVLLAACVTCACSTGRSPPGSFGDYYEKYKMAPAASARPPPGAIRVTFFGASTLLFDDGETEILVDGFVSRHGMLKVGLLPLSSEPAMVDAVVRHGEMERVAAVFVTHSHYDHALDVAKIITAAEERSWVDPEAARRAMKARAVVVGRDCADVQPGLQRIKLFGSESTLRIGSGGSLVPCQRVLLKPGEDVPVGPHFRVRALLSKHSPTTMFNNDLGEEIPSDLHQPARQGKYKEGGTYDFLITHGTHSILVKASANYIEDMLADEHADVAFLSIGRLGVQGHRFQLRFYDHAVRAVSPRLVIGTHWDNFFKPLDEELEPARRIVDDVPAGLAFLSDRLKADGVQFGLMQGFQRIDLFGGKYPGE